MGQMTLKTLAIHIAKIYKAHPDWHDKKIVISDDNEGNGFHGLFYGITDDTAFAKNLISDSESIDLGKILILG